MTDEQLDAFMDATAPLLGLRIDPAWRAAVRTNLAVTFRMAALVDGFPLPDDAEPAAVFVA